MDPVVKESKSGLLRVVDATKETTRLLKSLKVPIDSWDIIIEFIVMSKLPPASRMAWELEQKSTVIPKLSDLLNFLERRAAGLDYNAVQFGLANTQAQSTDTRSVNGKRFIKANLATTKFGECTFCKGKHGTGGCDKLWSMSAKECYGHVKSAGLCFNCVRSGHSTEACRSRGCKFCGKKHHSMLGYSAERANQRKSSHGQQTVTSPHGNTQQQQQPITMVASNAQQQPLQMQSIPPATFAPGWSTSA